MPRVGVIGIGFVGKLLVDALIEEGYDVVGHDVDPSKRAYLTEHGGAWASTPAALADEAEIVVIAVPGAPEVRHVFEDDQGLLATLDEGQMVIDTSTTGPDAAEAFAGMCTDRGVAFLTAPLTRNTPTGGVYLMVGGNEADYETATPLFDAVSDDHRRIGTHADAQTFKLILQARYACQAAVDAEIVAFARDHDLPPRLYREFLGLDVDERYLDRDFGQAIEGMGGLAIWHKDLGYGLDVARDDGTATPLVDAVFEAYKYATRTATEEEGHAATILRYWETLNDRDQSA